MPRTLPWIGGGGGKGRYGQVTEKATASSPSSRNTGAVPTNQTDDTDDVVDADLNTIGGEVAEPRPRKRQRSPSTSPPPAPPDVEYMREGFDADDIFLMVEDEFLSTAKSYTQHIHHAEYVRLKKLARSRGVKTLQTLDRPVDGRTAQSAAVRMRLEAESLSGRSMESLKRMRGNGYASSDEEEDEDEYMQDPQLAGLMMKSASKAKDLSGLLKPRANTRAAAGFSQSPKNVERKRDAFRDPESPVYSEEDGDDLDTTLKSNLSAQRTERDNRPNDYKIEMSVPSVSKRFAQPVGSPGKYDDRDAEVAGAHRVTTTNASDRQSSNQFSARSFTSPSPRREHRRVINDDWKTESDAFDTGKSSKLTTELVAKRRADKRKQEGENKRQAHSTDEIPTFLV